MSIFKRPHWVWTLCKLAFCTWAVYRQAANVVRVNDRLLEIVKLSSPVTNQEFQLYLWLVYHVVMFLVCITVAPFWFTPEIVSILHSDRISRLREVGRWRYFASKIWPAPLVCPLLFSGMLYSGYTLLTSIIAVVVAYLLFLAITVIYSRKYPE